MMVYVQTFMGDIVQLDVVSEDTIGHLISLISYIKTIPVCDIRLIYQNRQLRNDLTLLDYSIQMNSTIYMILRLRGC